MKFAITLICVLILALTAIEGHAQKAQSADLSQIVALLQKHDNALNQHGISNPYTSQISPAVALTNERRARTMADDSTTDRRGFLRSLGKWSAAAIAAVLLRESVTPPEASGWVNRRGSWVNGGGGGWANRGGSWINGGGGWINSGTNWINRGGSWLNGGGGWINRGGGGWLNSRGGGGAWVNRRG